ncbi:MAG: hypothetical protein ACLTS6_02360 [Anaerobutyricum sp.]
MTVGYAKDADDIGDVRKFVEYISYPGNPSLTRQADEDSTENSDRRIPILPIREAREIQILPIQK